MINFKLKTKIFIIILILLTTTNFSHSFCNPNNEQNFEEIIDYSDLDWDDIDDQEFRSPCDPIDLECLLEAAQNFSDPVWKLTKPPKGRDVLYLIPHKLLAIEYGGIICNIFYNSTNNMNYMLDEIINLDANKQAFECFIEALNKELSSKEISSLIPLFKKSSIQERKAGLLLQGGFFSGPFIFQINTSLQFSERNFWLNKKDQAEIKNILAQDGYSLETKEFYKYKIGLGDTRLKTGLNTLNMSNIVLDLGFEGIIPTSIISNIPHLKSYNIDFENYEKSLICVLNSIRDNMITPRLGNYGHLGLGCYAEAKVSLFHDSIHWWNRVSFDNFFVAKEDRLISSKQTMPSPKEDFQYFNNNILLPYLGGNPEPATEFLKQFLFPPAYRVTVKPGGIFTFVSAFTFSIAKKWNIGTGYDFYFQQAEKFTAIHNDVSPSSLLLKNAALPSSYQHKIFAEATHIKKHKRWDSNLGIGGDYTISSKRMGKDWTIFLRIGASF
ncbi:hypothetical protein ACFLYH_01730 [Candidatus Dependentiae bacterium]